MGSGAPRNLAFHLLEEMTDGFSEDRKLGSGAYGQVYMGEQKDGEKIAVKVLRDDVDDELFEKEYGNLASLQHQNIVRLVGYCHETRREFAPYKGKNVLAGATHKALCFEYMHKGSLDNILSDESNGHVWRTRYTIIKGICKGLKYLHEEMESPLYHLDLKPANVLLDENMVPKIADFGLSRIFREEQTRVTKDLIGTIGYLPPEYIDGAVISIKFDIFSLGVIIIKIMTGPKGYFRIAEMSSQQFIEHVHEKWRNRLEAESVYELESYSEQVRACIEIALTCVEADRRKRPSIGEIVNKLSETETMIQSSPDALTNEPAGLSMSQGETHTTSRKEESGPAQQAAGPPDAQKSPTRSDHEKEKASERPPPPEGARRRSLTPENCFGDVVNDYKLDGMARYAGKPKTQEDRAREAWNLANEGDKDGRARRYVDGVKAAYGVGQSTLCLVYNATGDTLVYVDDHDWWGYIGRVPYPAEIGNGQWAAFHHVHKTGDPSGSVAAVVYRGKNRDGQDRDYLLAWSTPWGFWYRNKAYCEIGDVDYFERHRWGEIYDKWYIIDYFIHEEFMTSTWDIIAERLGFMLVFGDLGWWLLKNKVEVPLLAAVANLDALPDYLVFRGANKQKHVFKKNPKALIWDKPPKVVGGKLLASGYWGIARHCNYIGDLLALSFSLPCGASSVIPYFYPTYLLILLIWRERRDEARCSQKYKEIWVEYCKLVPWRILPYVY